MGVLYRLIKFTSLGNEFTKTGTQHTIDIFEES